MKIMTLPRPEYPRPQFVRDDWENLNGTWEFAFDDANEGLRESWHKGQKALGKRIQVPFAFESKLSGIGETGFHDVVWYRRAWQTPASFEGKRVLLHFGAVDYEASVWVNGDLVATHVGGHTPFSADVTDALAADGSNVIVVRAEDRGTDLHQPRGKQYWKEKSEGIFYTRTTGIWQTVWAEAVYDVHLEKVHYEPDIDRNDIRIRAFVKGPVEGRALSLRTRITFGGEFIAEDVVSVSRPEECRQIHLSGAKDQSTIRFWSPGRPNLYDVEFELLEDGKPIDRAASYFGMRKVSIENGKLCLNNRPYFLKFVLDQGYFPDGILTPPSSEALRQDVELTKAMGFNGARKHQKVEDPLYLYWCDKLGLLVWGEMANAYEYSEKYVRRITSEWQEVVERDRNHPSIIAWVPINESWGVPNIQIDKRQQQHALSMYHLTKSLDATRPVVSNDGWEMVETDLYSIHDYQWREEVLAERYSTIDRAVNAMPAGIRLSVGGHSYAGQPILVTEFGGIGYKKSEWEGWGYSGASDDEDYLKRLAAVIRPLRRSGIVQGYCYTQLTDVEQEINGLLTYDRVPKVPVEKIKEIVDAM